MQGPLRGPVKWGSIYDIKFTIKDIKQNQCEVYPCLPKFLPGGGGAMTNVRFVYFQQIAYCIL